MPYIQNTPESLVSRSDSKNPATTCRGITASGVPCRRGLASSPAQTPGKGSQKTDITKLYCWQHRDQAESTLRQATWKSSSNTAQNQRRSSIDTLMDRLGVLDLNTSPSEKPTKYPKKKKQYKSTFCCFTIIEDEEPAPLPPRPKPHPTRPPPGRPPPGPGHGHGHRPKPSQTQNHPTNTPPKIPSNSKPHPLLRWIPQSLTPQTTSLLFAELAKPISPADEPGYIYMFWVTPSTSPKSAPPPADIASALLPSAKKGVKGTRGAEMDECEENEEAPEQIQRSDTAIRRARDLDVLASNPTSHTPGTVRLKIGRTSNVTRRLNEWTRQCSNHLTLIRYYPYTCSSDRRTEKGHKAGIELGRKVPHVHRVERLIHLELADMRARHLGNCQECGKEHREWFEVAAERKALKRVDECIRRWVRWAHAQQ